MGNGKDKLRVQKDVSEEAKPGKNKPFDLLRSLVKGKRGDDHVKTSGSSEVQMDMLKKKDSEYLQYNDQELAYWKVQTSKDYHEENAKISKRDKRREGKVLSAIEKKWTQDINTIMEEFSRGDSPLAKELQSVLKQNEEAYLRRVEHDPTTKELQAAYDQAGSSRSRKDTIENQMAFRKFQLFQTFYIGLRVDVTRCLQKAGDTTDLPMPSISESGSPVQTSSMMFKDLATPSLSDQTAKGKSLMEDHTLHIEQRE